MRRAAAATEKRYAPARGLAPDAKTAATSGHFFASASGDAPWNEISHVARMSGKTRTRPSPLSSPRALRSSSSLKSSFRVGHFLAQEVSSTRAVASPFAFSDVASAHLRSTSRASHSSRHESTVSMTSPRMSISRSSCCTIRAPTAGGTSAFSFPSSVLFSFASPSSARDGPGDPVRPASAAGPPFPGAASAANARLASLSFPRNTVFRSLCTAARSTPSEKDNERSRVKSSASMNEMHRAGNPSRPARPACWM
mmetsp:Transcript_9707/g.41235  ORF Transcript_9707/g.41235 Transcript_9707/m.41235 type:complete len:254 (-) Transcript_9707:1020-1781(-)